MKFWYYRYFMNHINLFQSKKTKAELLIENLKESFSFKWYSWTDLAFEPLKVIDDQYIIGYLRKKQSIKLSKKDKEDLKFTDEKVENWPKTLMIINCSDDKEKWQTIVIEQKSFVFRDQPLQHIKYLFDVVNKKLFDNWYIIQVEPIQKPNKFWETIDNINKKSQKIYSVEFSLNMPNLFWIEDSLSEDLKNAQESYWATKAVVRLSNEESWLNLKVDDTFLSQSINYTEKWWWNYTIWLKKRKISSKKQIRSEDIEVDVNIENADENALRLILNKIFDA